MALPQRIEALHKRHHWLDEILSQEMSHPHPDETRMMQIKKSKLRVKDEIAELECISRKIEDVATHEAEYRRRVVH